MQLNKNLILSLKWNLVKQFTCENIQNVTSMTNKLKFRKPKICLRWANTHLYLSWKNKNLTIKTHPTSTYSIFPQMFSTNPSNSRFSEQPLNNVICHEYNFKVNVFVVGLIILCFYCSFTLLLKFTYRILDMFYYIVINISNFFYLFASLKINEWVERYTIKVEFGFFRMKI